MMIGASQNFFRSRINSHSSPKKLVTYLSSLKKVLRNDQAHGLPWAPDRFLPWDQIPTEAAVFPTDA